jgi:hypothetical protein
MILARCAITVAILALVPLSASGQAEQERQVGWAVARAVLIDPTTYAPAVISYSAMLSDWNTSQVLFDHGWLEMNRRFTISGRPNDVPVSYDEGRQQIRQEALMVLGFSAMNNTAVAVGERLLIARYPSHRKLIRTLSWVERIAYASFIAYRNSADHFRQAEANRKLARAYGY